MLEIMNLSKSFLISRQCLASSQSLARVSFLRPFSSDAPPPSFSSIARKDLYSKPPGTEDWHIKQTVPGSGGKAYRWPAFNDRIFPPGDDPNNPGHPRPAYVCHMRANVKYSPKKMWHVANMVLGLSVEDALKQLSFVSAKGALIAKEVIEEAQEIAVREHNVEFKTNLWVAESFSNKSDVIRGYRRHARGRMCVIEYVYCNYCIRLEEGKPPKDFYEYKRKLKPEELLENYIKTHRSRTIPSDQL